MYFTSGMGVSNMMQHSQFFWGGDMRFEIVTAVLWDVTLVNGYQHFGGTLLPSSG